MLLPIQRRLTLTPEGFIYWFAAFNGLAYYACILLINQFLPFEKGILRFATSLVFLMIALFFYLRHKQRVFTLKPQQWPMAIYVMFAYFGWSLLSFIWSNTQDFQAQGYSLVVFYLAQWVNYLIEFLTILIICKVTNASQLALHYLKGLRLGGLILALAYLIVWVFIEKAGRLSTFGEGVLVIHPNNLALKLAISSLCSFHLFAIKPNKRQKDILIVALFTIPTLFAMMLTVGKTVLLAFMVAFLFYILHIPLQRRMKLPILIVTLLVMCMGLPFVADYMSRYLETGSLNTLSGRTELWQITWDDSWQHPWIGHGIASPFATLLWNVDRSGQSGTAHNDYLNAFYQMGLIGFLIVTMLYGTFITAAFKTRKNAEFRQNTSFCMALFIIMFIFSLTASFPVGFAVPFTFQMIMHYWMGQGKTVTQRTKPPYPELSPAPLTTQNNEQPSTNNRQALA